MGVKWEFDIDDWAGLAKAILDQDSVISLALFESLENFTIASRRDTIKMLELNRRKVAVMPAITPLDLYRVRMQIEG